MARKPAARSDGQMVIRAFSDKTKKVTVGLPPAMAEKLRVAAVGLGVDQGDIVATGLDLVLRSVEVRVRVVPAAPADAPDSGDGEGGSGLRIA